ncbi:MAG TPA: discoidin domain-containing protein, partial [Thermoanaerobaculia bacterium]|nr:discoidin domain-containing protein [Thermoanaerobaculia bacterium]
MIGLIGSGRGGAEDFSGRAILSDQTYSSGDIGTDVFDQIYELRFGRRVSDPFTYLLFFRGEQSNGHSTVADETSTLRFTQLEPHAEATYTLPTIQLFGRWDLVDSRSKISGSPDDRRQLEHIFSTFSFQPDRLPGFRFLFQRDHASSDTSALDQTRTYLQGSLDFRWKNLSATATARRSEFEDAENGLTRKSDGVQGSLVFQDTLLNNRLTVFANALASFDRETDTTRSRGASGETPVPIFEALETIDDTPEDSRGDAGIPAPALIDGNLRVPTVIDLGPTGASFQNIAIDLRRFTGLDTFRIDIRDSGGNVVPRGEPVDFTVYTSTDGIRWTPVAGARTTFLAPESLYEVTFPKTVARLFKVVSFDLAPTDARVTEIRAFFHDEFGPATTRTSDIKLG